MHISFSEILVILLVALLVIKPEQMPEVANKLGRWVKTVKRMIAQVKHEASPELGKYSFHEDKM